MKTQEKRTIQMARESEYGKLKAYQKEYPWLTEYLPNRVLSIKTSRVNEELLVQRLEFCPIELVRESFSLNPLDDKNFDLSSLQGILSKRYIYLDMNGKYLGETGIEKCIDKPSIFNCWFPKPYYVQIDYETVFEGILRILTKEAEITGRGCYYNVHYIVSLDWHGNVVVYKPPKLETNDLLYWDVSACQRRKLIKMVIGLDKKQRQLAHDDFVDTLKEIESV